LLDEEGPLGVHWVSSVPGLNMAAKIDMLIKNSFPLPGIETHFVDFILASRFVLY
jgi:hypothetical protein